MESEGVGKVFEYFDLQLALDGDSSRVVRFDVPVGALCHRDGLFGIVVYPSLLVTYDGTSERISYNLFPEYHRQGSRLVLVSLLEVVEDVLLEPLEARIRFQHRRLVLLDSVIWPGNVPARVGVEAVDVTQ